MTSYLFYRVTSPRYGRDTDAVAADKKGYGQVPIILVYYLSVRILKIDVYSNPYLLYIYIQALQAMPHPSKQTSRTGEYKSRRLFPVPLAHTGSLSS